MERELLNFLPPEVTITDGGRNIPVGYWSTAKLVCLRDDRTPVGQKRSTMRQRVSDKTTVQLEWEAGKQHSPLTFLWNSS
jgi:hypothetical protein